MKYYKAESVLPADLLAEVQKYVPSGVLYIAKNGIPRHGWGELSGERKRLDQRNAQIRARHRQSVSIARLSEEYHLAVDTIKKIVYGK